MPIYIIVLEILTILFGITTIALCFYELFCIPDQCDDFID